MPRATHALAASLAIAAAAVLAPRVAAAESRLGPSVRLVVEPSEGCPSEADFEAALRGTLGASAIDEAPSARYAIAFGREDRAVTGTLVVTAEGDATPYSRSVRASTCREAAEALALVIVLSIDPLVTEGPRFPGPIVPPKEPPPRPRVRRAERVAQPPEAIHLGAGLAVGAVTGILPGLAPVLDASATVRRRSLELHASLGAALPVEDDVAGGTLRFWSLRARLAACAVFDGFAPVSLGGCAGGSVDWVFTDGRGFLLVGSSDVAVPAAVVGGIARYAFGPKRRFRAGLELDAGVVLAPTTWNVLPSGNAHETSTFTTRFAGVVEVDLF